MKKVTIKEVAEYTGLSITTVSRYINNNYPVSAEAKEKIEQAIQILGYKPNLVARSLKKSNTGIIGLIVADVSNRFFMKVAKGLEDTLSEEGYQIIFASNDGSVEKEHKLIAMFEERRVDALVVASTDTKPDTLNDFARNGIPVIALDRWIDGLHADAVVQNNVEAANQLMRILLEHGHRNIALNNVLLNLYPGRGRRMGALKALEEYGVPFRESWDSQGYFTREESAHWVQQLFETPGEVPTAIFCSNNVMAEGALIGLKSRGLHVPEDVSLVSFGIISMSDYIEPQITSISQDPYQMGVATGKLTLKRLKGELSAGFVFKREPVRLIEGGSVKRIN